MAQDVGVSAIRFTSSRIGIFYSNRQVFSVLSGWIGKKWSSSEGRPFFAENFHLNRASHLHFNRLDWKFWLNGKGPPGNAYRILVYCPRNMLYTML